MNMSIRAKVKQISISHYTRSPQRTHPNRYCTISGILVQLNGIWDVHVPQESDWIYHTSTALTLLRRSNCALVLENWPHLRHLLVKR
jgi:hypothetical protein